MDVLFLVYRNFALNTIIIKRECQTNMKILLYLSEWLLPLLIFYIIGFGILSKRQVFDDFLKGAGDGMRTVAGILPTLIGLMTAVGVLRASGFLEAMSELLRDVTRNINIPTELVPVVLVRMVSNSAAVSLVLDIFSIHGPDSEIGTIASIVLGSTETIFYTMSVYFMSARIGKTRWTLPGALLTTAAGVVVSIFIGKIYCGS